MMRSLAAALLLAVLPAIAPLHAAHAQSVLVSGMVSHPGPVDVPALSALKQVPVTGTFDSMSGKQTHRWTGPLLLDVLGRAMLVDEPGKRTTMRHVILARGADGYAAAIAYGEIDTKGAGKTVIVALTQDEKPLKVPRLIVPGDASLTRSIHDLVELNVR